MASASVTATMAAAGFDKRSSAASTLQTPASGTFPSELRSPLVGSPGLLRKEDLKTPITPPSAYLDFLKNTPSALLSPAPTSTSAHFSFKADRSDKSLENPVEKTSVSPPTSQLGSQPALSRNTSYDSNTSFSTTSSEQSAASRASISSNGSTVTKTGAESPRVSIPPSPFAKPAPRSARTPRRLHIPQSPFSATMPTSAMSQPSPYSSTPLSAAPWSASFSPTNVDPEINGKPGKVSVRQVVTRTVTYCRTPLEPAPKGKRRKLDIDSTSDVDVETLPSSKSSSEEPPVKQEQEQEEASARTTTSTHES